MAQLPSPSILTAPLHVVIFLHGWTGCVRQLALPSPAPCRDGQAEFRPGWDLFRQHRSSRTHTLFVVPQLVYLKRDGGAGRFRQPGFARRWLTSLVGLVATAHGETDAKIASITLVAHSAGYETALAIVQHGELTDRIANVILLDALYAGAPAFAAWMADNQGEGKRLLSLYTGRDSTRRQSLRLARLLRRSLGRHAVAENRRRPVEQLLADYPVVISRARYGHSEIPKRILGRILSSLPFPPRTPPRP